MLVATPIRSLHENYSFNIFTLNTQEPSAVQLSSQWRNVNGNKKTIIYFVYHDDCLHFHTLDNVYNRVVQHIATLDKVGLILTTHNFYLLPNKSCIKSNCGKKRWEDCEWLTSLDFWFLIFDKDWIECWNIVLNIAWSVFLPGFFAISHFVHAFLSLQWHSYGTRMNEWMNKMTMKMKLFIGWHANQIQIQIQNRGKMNEIFLVWLSLAGCWVKMEGNGRLPFHRFPVPLRRINSRMN